jgi:NDP-sugar pyrophosphorylase family protein
LNSYYFETLNLIKRTDLILNANERAKYHRVIDKCNSYVSRDSVKLGKNVRIDRNVLIESNCRIGDGCELVNCLIGSKCVLGTNVKLSNCILWPNTHIGSNSVLNASLLGNNVRIGNNCNLCENLLFSNDCAVKDNTQLTKRGVFVSTKVVKETLQVSLI